MFCGYLTTTSNHQLCAELVYFVYDGDPVFHRLTDPATQSTLPSARVATVVVTQANSKTIGTGHHAPKRGEETTFVFANPFAPTSSPTLLCPLQALQQYVVARASARTWRLGEKLFSIKSADVTATLQRVALATGLDPSRLTARSIRSGSATQLDTVAARIVGAINNEVVAAAGHWAEGHNGNVGVHAYQERPHDHAKAAALYTVGDHTLERLRAHYMAPAPAGTTRNVP